MGKHTYYFADGRSFTFESYYEDFDSKFKDTFNFKFNNKLHDHRLDGPVYIWHGEFFHFYLYGNAYSKEEYYNHPDVKRQLLLKALKNLK
jgi:hypothetical protein